MSNEQNRALFRQFNEEVINRRNLAAIETFMAPDFVEHEELPTGTPPGREGTKQLIAGLLDAFPDLHITTDDAMTDGEKVISRETWRGTHQGTFLGIAPTRRSVTFTAINIVRIEGGTLMEHWGVADFLGLLQRLQAVPSPAQ